MISCRRRQIAQLSAYSTFHNKWCSLAFDWLKNMTDILIFSNVCISHPERSPNLVLQFGSVDHQTILPDKPRFLLYNE